MSGIFSRIGVPVVLKKYPITKGAAIYAVTWPVSNLCQQAISGNEEFDFVQVLRYSAFGALYVAPTLYGWVKLSSAMWPSMNIKIALTKALVEQVSYGPFAMVSFFFGMSLLEGKTLGESAKEAKVKFWPTLEVGICVWPAIQTINYALIPERNRVMFVGFCSMVWTCFLAYMKQQQLEKLELNH